MVSKKIKCVNCEALNKKQKRGSKIIFVGVNNSIPLCESCYEEYKILQSIFLEDGLDLLEIENNESGS